MRINKNIMAFLLTTPIIIIVDKLFNKLFNSVSLLSHLLSTLHHAT